MGRCIDCAKGSQVFKGKCYTIFRNESTSWNQARAKCQSLGGDLVNVDDDNFFSFWIPFVYNFDLLNTTIDSCHTLVN